MLLLASFEGKRTRLEILNQNPFHLEKKKKKKEEKETQLNRDLSTGGQRKFHQNKNKNKIPPKSNSKLYELVN